MMLSVVIKGPTFREAYQQIREALNHAHLIELRLDIFDVLDMTALKELRSHFSIPMIFTLRSREHGGYYKSSEEERQADLIQLATLQPEYIDLESHLPSSFIKKIASQTKLILSYHNFIETPQDLDALYQEMQKNDAFFYKIALTAQNCLDALRTLCWAKKSDPKLIVISMGSAGQMSRILSPYIGNPITYAVLEEDPHSPIGQLSVHRLIERYHHHLLHPDTKLYGLIGDPVEQSISDRTHNHFMRASGIDAIYVKIEVKAVELCAFLQLAKQIPFHGLSVTMPLKEKVLPFLDFTDPQAMEIGAVNTLLFENGELFGYNTDGIGALKSLEKKVPSVKGKRIVIIGAGGAAKAIAYEATRRGGLVTIVNRDREKAFRLAHKLQCKGEGLDYMTTCVKEGYDILINCTPLPLPIAAEYILSDTVVMDIVTLPKETLFLKVAAEKGCQIVYGYQMFREQALGQFALWFQDCCIQEKATDFSNNK